MLLVLVFMPQGPVRPGPVMTRGVLALILIAAVLIAVPLAITNDFYLNLASQILIYALLAVSLNCWSAMAVWSRSATPRSSGSPGYSPCDAQCRIRPASERESLVLFSTACGGAIRPARLARFGIGFLMITLALGQIVWASHIGQTR